MKKYEICSGTWHYRLATCYGNFNEYNRQHQNICVYRWRVIWGACTVAIIIAVASAILSSFVCLGIASYAAYTNHIIIGEVAGLEIVPALCTIAPGIIGAVLAGFVYTLIGLVGVCIAISDRFPTTDEDGFTTTAYRSFKEKVCIPIKIVHKKK